MFELSQFIHHIPIVFIKAAKNSLLRMIFTVCNLNIYKKGTLKDMLSGQVTKLLLGGILSLGFANSLWQKATSYMQTQQTIDNRALHCGRLQMAKQLTVSTAFYQLPMDTQSKLMADFELARRSLNNMKFTKDTDN